MATLATLDQTGEALVQSLEHESGVWAVAYRPDGLDENPPAYAERLKPADLDEPALRRLQEVEQRTGSVIVAYEPLPAA